MSFETVREREIMGCKNELGFKAFLFLVLLWQGFSLGDNVNKQEIVNETIIVSMLPGEAQGQYFYYFSAGCRLYPSSFAIDPNDGSFYIPEINPKYGIRIHKFDPQGKLMDMLRINHIPNGLYHITVDLSGDIYLVCGTSRIGNYLIRCDKSGKILNLFGPEGTITDEEIANASKPESKLYEKKFFRGMFDSFSVIDGQLEVVVQNDQNKRKLYQFDKENGRKMKEEITPAHIENKINTKREKRDVLHKSFVKNKRKGGIADFVKGVDGEWFYMVVSRDKLEIVNVTFAKDKE